MLEEWQRFDIHCMLSGTHDVADVRGPVIYGLTEGDEDRHDGGVMATPHHYFCLGSAGNRGLKHGLHRFQQPAHAQADDSIHGAIRHNRQKVSSCLQRLTTISEVFFKIKLFIFWILSSYKYIFW